MLRYEQELDAVLQTIVTRWGIPGLSVGVTQGDEIIYIRGFGVQSLDTGAPIEPDSIFCTASIAKCFVASAVMQLVEQGHIQLDTPLIEYLPFFKLDDVRYTQITIRQMLSHTSGMPDMEDDEYDALLSHPEFDDAAAERYVRALSRRKMVAAPGERFMYSNIAYNVLGFLIAQISGQTFEAYMREHILLPAGMPDSTFLLSEVERRQLAVPHLRTPEMCVNPVYPYHRADAPASFLHSTVTDMCHWGAVCLNRGHYQGRQLLGPASYEQMWTPAARWGYPPLYEDMGLGWTLGHFDGTRTISHGGMGFGWSDFFTVLPEKGRAAIVMCNEESGARRRTVYAVIQAILDRPPQTGTISWMIPIIQAWQEGGMAAAWVACTRLQEGGDPDYELDADDLVNLVLQLLCVEKRDLAIEMLQLNTHAFPEHTESHLYLARLYLESGRHAQAEASLRRVLSIEPDHAAAAELLDRVRRNNLEL